MSAHNNVIKMYVCAACIQLGWWHCWWCYVSLNAMTGYAQHTWKVICNIIVLRKMVCPHARGRIHQRLTYIM